MSEDTPYATPYPWDSPSALESQTLVNERLRKRRFVGSGFASLQKDLYRSDSSMGGVAKKTLKALLEEHGVDIGTEGIAKSNSGFKQIMTRPYDREAVTPGSTDDEVLKRARNGKLSIFASLLSVIESQPGPVTTKHLLRSCSMTLRPGDLPGSLDAKEMVLSALHFLSSEFEGDMLTLPLIKPVQQVGDLEKRSYEKCGDWVLADVKHKVLTVEKVYVSSPSSWRWLRREAFAPRLPAKDETSFFLKGVIPASASAKKVKGEAARKRKATASPSATSPSPVPELLDDSATFVTATVVAEGSPSHSVS